MNQRSAGERIIVALDVSGLDTTSSLVERLASYVGMFKIGKQLFTAHGPEAIRRVQDAGGKVFLDLKYHDIPNTVAGASAEATRHGVAMFNVHCSGGLAMMRSAREASEKAAIEGGFAARPCILGVTVLTSLGHDDFSKIGLFPMLRSDGPEELREKRVRELVLDLGCLAEEAGLDGVVASPKEVRPIRESCGSSFLIVTPGIRPAGTAKQDQVRTGTPQQAIADGADYLVVGRPITESADPVDVARRIAEEVAAAMAERR